MRVLNNGPGAKEVWKFGNAVVLIERDAKHKHFEADFRGRLLRTMGVRGSSTSHYS